MNLRERLSSTPHFQELDPSELDTLAEAMEVIEAEDGRVFIRAGQRGDGCFFVVEGSVGVSHERDGQTVLLHALGPGELFGIVSLLDGGNRSATCSAVGPTTVAWLPAAAFTLLHEGKPALVLHFQKLVARQLASDTRKLNATLVRAMLAQQEGQAGPGASLSGELHLTTGD
jgi:CRP-like cAMP-binding protein